MANLKRNMIELVEEVKEGEVVTKKYLTPAFIPLSVYYQAIDISNQMDTGPEANERDNIDKLVDFVANDIYKGQFTKEQLINGLHAPSAVEILQEQLLFVVHGYQSEETKNFLAKKS